MITLWLLRQIEQKLTVQIGKWEEEHERSFLINGCHYMNIINNQWAAFNAQKEQEKVERVSNKPGTKTNRPAMHTEAIASSIELDADAPSVHAHWMRTVRYLTFIIS